MAGRADPKCGLRRLGWSRVYRLADMPDRLFEWHRPRPGRWERLRVTAGVLQVELLRGGAIHAGRLEATADAVHDLLCGGTLSCQALDVSGAGLVGFVQHVDGRLALGAYLRRDHAVIESALAGFLDGRQDRLAWMVNLLERHIRIEEELLFPRYLEAGGRRAWARSLEMEHRQLQCLLRTEAADSDGWVRMLDSHEEKGERIVYLDVIRALGASGGALVGQAVLFPSEG